MREPDGIRGNGEFAVFGMVELYPRDGSFCIDTEDGSVDIMRADEFRDDLAAAIEWYERREKC